MYSIVRCARKLKTKIYSERQTLRFGKMRLKLTLKWKTIVLKLINGDITHANIGISQSIKFIRHTHTHTKQQVNKP